jgi:hypothetical protein
MHRQHRQIVLGCVFADELIGDRKRVAVFREFPDDLPANGTDRDLIKRLGDQRFIKAACLGDDSYFEPKRVGIAAQCIWNGSNRGDRS